MRIEFSNLGLTADWNDGDPTQQGNRELNGINHIKLKSDNAIVLGWIMVRKTSEGEEHAKSLDASDFIRIDSTVGDGDVEEKRVVGATIPSGEQDFDGDGISNLYELEAMSKGSRFYDPFVSNYRYAVLYAQGINTKARTLPVIHSFGWNDCLDWANMLCASPDNPFNPGYGWNPKDVHLLFFEGVDPNSRQYHQIPFEEPILWGSFYPMLNKDIDLRPGTFTEFTNVREELTKESTNHTQVVIIISGHGSSNGALGIYDPGEDDFSSSYYYNALNNNIAMLNPSWGYEYDIDTAVVVSVCYYGQDEVDDLADQLHNCLIISSQDANETGKSIFHESSDLNAQLLDFLYDREFLAGMHTFYHGLLLDALVTVIFGAFVSVLFIKEIITAAIGTTLIIFFGFVIVPLVMIIYGGYKLSQYDEGFRCIENAYEYARIQMEFGFLCGLLNSNRSPGFNDQIEGKVVL